MYVNFRFTAEQAAAPVGRGASYLLNFRDDYNQSTQSFTNQNTIYISRQIIITAWASETHRSGAKGIAISEISYFGVIWKIRLFAERKQYLIDAQSNLNSMKNFDVFVFVRYLRDAFQVFRTMEFLVTVQTGFRYNTGRGKFIVHELEYEYNPNFQTSKIDLQI
jgi:hypothetical protein